VLTETKAHCEALQGGLNRLVAERVKVDATVAPEKSGSPAAGSAPEG
jgi:hypothetical protein